MVITGYKKCSVLEIVLDLVFEVKITCAFEDPLPFCRIISCGSQMSRTQKCN